MNDQLQQLAKQARIHMVSEPRLQEFAELILNKCIDICVQGSSTQMTSNGAAQYIKMYFGIE